MKNTINKFHIIKWKGRPLWFTGAFGVAGLLFLVLALVVRFDAVSDAEVLLDEKHQMVNFPWHAVMQVDEIAEFRFDFSYKSWTNTVLRIIPDDFIQSVHVNDQKVRLDTIPRRKRYDYVNGFFLDLQPMLNPGDNQVKIVVQNKGGRGGLNLLNPLSDRAEWISAVFLLLAFLSVCLGVLFRNRPGSLKVSWMFFAGSVVGVILLILGLAIEGRSVEKGAFCPEGFVSSKCKVVRFPHWENRKFTKSSYSIVYEKQWLAPSRFRIIADDRLETIKVNDAEVDLSIYSDAELADWEEGIVLDLSDYLITGKNKIIVQIKNLSGRGGLGIEKENGPVHGLLLVFLWSVGILLLLHRLLIHHHLNRIEMFVFAGGVITLVWYMVYTPGTVRVFDVFEGGGHKDYIMFLKDHLRLPNPGQGWEYHQPPLYYAMAAFSVMIVEPLFGLNWIESLRLFSVVCYGVFLIYAYSSVRYVCRFSKLRYFALALLVFWPAGVIHASRVGNDVLMYTFSAMSFYYLLRWWRTGKMDHFDASLLFLFLGLLTKSSAVIVAGVLAGLLILKMFVEHPRLYVNEIAKSVAVIAFAFAINLGDNIYFAMKDGSDWLLVNVGNSLHQGLKVANGLVNYVYLDLSIFFKEAYTSTWEDWGGRQYFWNFFLKSSLFSEYQFDSLWHKRMGVALSGLLLLMIVYPLLGIKSYTRRFWYKSAPFLLLIVSAVGALLAYRIKVPVSCNTDFRYILPILVGAVGFLFATIEVAKSKWYKRGLMVLTGSFAAISALFYLSWGLFQ